MGEVGVVGPVGAWDQDLFERFRAAPKGRRTKPGEKLDPRGALRRRLKEEIIRINTPLIKKLVSQVQGTSPPAQLRGRPAMRLVGAKDIEWDVALNLGRFACSKALETLDLRKGSFSGYLVKKIYYELQCEVGRQNMIRVDRGARPMGLEYLEDDEQLGRLELEEEPEETPPQIALLDEFEERMGPLIAPPPAPPPPPPPPDTRSVLEFFLEEHCRFSPPRRTMMTAVTGALHWLARDRGELVERGALSRALRDRGVRPITMRVPWSESRVKGLAGLWLQSTCAEPGPL